MTKELLLATRDDFTAATGNDEQAQRVQRIYRILRQEGLYNWHLKPFTRDGFVPKMAAVFGLSQIGSVEIEKFKKFLEAQTGGRSDAAIDELYTALGRARLTGAARKRVVDGWNALWAETWSGVPLTYEMEASRGPQTITLTWDMERARFTIRILEEGDATTKKMQTTITGLVGFAFDQKARNLIVSVRPAQMPITSGSPDIQSATAQPRLGPPIKKKDKASDKKEKGKDKTSPKERTDKQEQIDAKRKRIEEIKADKAHIWENTESKEKIRQKKFRKLKEPFEYKGEGYAEPDADDEIKRLDREIAELEDRAPPVDANPTLAKSSERGLTLHKSVGDMSLHLDKEIYYVGDVIPIYYSYPPHKEESDKGISYQLMVTSKNDFDVDVLNEAGMTLDGKYWKSGEQAPYNDIFDLGVASGLMKLRSRISRDVTVTLIRKKGGAVLTEIKKQFLLRQPKYKPIPGALIISGGNRFNYTEFPTVQVNLPPSISKEDLSNFRVEFFYLRAKTRGRAIEKTPAAAYNYSSSSHSPRLSHYPYGRSDPVESHAQEIEMKYTWGFLYHGTYEFRLVQNDFESFDDGYVVDSIRFEIVHETWKKALRIVSPEDPNVNEPIVLRIDSEALPFKDSNNEPLKYYDVYLYKVVEDILELDGALMDIMSDDVYLKFISYKLNVVQDTDIEFNVVDQFSLGLKAGKYIFMVGHLGKTVHDILEVDVTGRRNQIKPQHGFLPGANVSKTAGAFMQTLNSMYIRVGDKRRFVKGDKVPFEAYSQGLYGAKSMIKASLHHAVSYDGPLGEKVKEWDMIPGKKMAWTISEDLPIGEYRLALYDSTKGIDNPSPNKTDYFRVVPKFGEGKIEIKDEREFLTDEKINIKFTYPKSVKSRDFKYTYGIFRKGGFLPGCVKVKDRWGGHDNGNPLDKSQTIAIRAPLPGNYVVKLFGWPNEEFAKERKPVVLAEASFSTGVKWEPSGLSFPSGNGEFNWGDAIPVNVNVREDLGEGASYLRLDKVYKDEPSKYVLETYQLGDVTYGGAHRFPIRIPYAFHSGYGVKGHDQLILDKESAKKLLPPGAYEFRLSNHEYGFIIARIPFKVVDPDSPFPWEGGNPKFDRPSDIEPPRLARGLYAEEYLDSANCAALLKPEVEPMTLTFVKWDEDQHKYLPVEGALEYGQSFYIEGKLEKEASLNFYPAEIKGSSGRAQEVILWTDEDDKTVVRSERLYSIWEDTEVEE